MEENPKETFWKGVSDAQQCGVCLVCTAAWSEKHESTLSVTAALFLFYWYTCRVRVQLSQSIKLRNQLLNKKKFPFSP